MRVLIWNPIWVLGGGYHLMTNLIEQLSDHPSVSKLTAAINPKYGGQIDKHLLGERSSKVFVDLQSDLAEYATGHDIVFATWPHGMPLPDVSIPTVTIYHDTILTVDSMEDKIALLNKRQLLDGFLKHSSIQRPSIKDS